ncbi:MAG TPA: portal protein, partial [Polyangiales bacterium]|nr:portal protein [Polyangiales bacterium]
MGTVLGMRTTGERWWEAEQDEAHGGVFQAATAIAAQQGSARDDDALYMRMYGPTDGLRTGSKAKALDLSSRNGLMGQGYNLIRSAVNTAVAHVGSQRTKPRFVTDDADWSLVKRAKACEQVIKGIFDAERFYEKAGECFRDAGVTRIAAMFVFLEDGRARLERTMPGELLVDVREGYAGAPRTLYRLKAVERQVLKEKYDLAELPPPSTLDRQLFNAFPWLSDDVQSTADQTMTITAWRLPCGKLPGRRVVAIAGKTLDDCEYKRKRFPFAFFKWNPQQTGFYGTSIAAELRGHQRKINYLDIKIADILHKNSRSNLVTFNSPTGASSVNVQHLDNDPATIIQVKGNQPPIQLTANAVPPELFQHRREVIQDAFAQIGITELQATGQVDLGPRASGAAIREVRESGSRRWKDRMQAWDQFAVDTARAVID